MNEYLVIIKILKEVFAGKNLKDSFNYYTIQEKLQNLGKVKDISYGICRNYYFLEYIINSLIENRPDDHANIILYIAIYEIEFTKKPYYAIVNDLVKLSYNLTKKIKVKNFINAVIRNYLRKQEVIKSNINNNIEVKYNFPLWFINKLQADYPEQYINILSRSNIKPKLNLRVNKSKISITDYLTYLDEKLITYKVIDDCIVVDTNLSVKNIPLFDSGYVSIQDINAQKLIKFVEFRENMHILDVCAAPGGKTCQILENYKVDLVALDIDKSRLEKVRQNLIRLNLKAKLLCSNATKLDWWDGVKFDIVIADVPCSASGTIKKNPDIKLHRQLADINNFVTTQRDIVKSIWQTLKNEGYLVYITCSIFKEENQENIKFFLNTLKGIKFIRELRLLPDENGDGFYYCMLQKIGDQ